MFHLPKSKDSLSFPLQEKVKAVFDNLIQLEHLNIVKFHKYWADVKENRTRVCDLHTLGCPPPLVFGSLYRPGVNVLCCKMTH